MKRGRFLGTVMVALFLCVPGAAAGGYTVSSGYDHPAEGTCVQPESVSFWELPFWILLLQFAVLPAELFSVLKWWGIAGLTRFNGKDLLENDTRRKIYECIRTNPGIHMRGIGKKTDITLGTLRYHIGMLQKSHAIATVEDRGYTHYYENSGTYSTEEQQVLKHLQNATTRKILRVLATHPSATRTDIAESVGIAGSTVTWHMKRLAEDGVIDVHSEGRSVTYTIHADAEPAIHSGRSAAATDAA